MNLLGLTLLLAWSAAEGYLPSSPRRLQCYNTLSRRCIATLHATGGDEDGNELVVAARHGDVATMERVLTEEPRMLNSGASCSKPPQMDGATALIWASRMGFEQAVELLLKKKNIDVNAVTATGWTALYAAAMNGEEECVEALLLAGADIEAAMALDDEFTNVKLLRMVEDAGIDRSLQIVAPSTPVVDDEAESSADWRANAKPVAVQDPVVIQSLAGLDAAAELRLKLQWSAPPSDEEDSTATLERKTVFKLRTERLAELEAGGLASTTQAVAPAGARPAAPVASAAPLGGDGGGGASIQALEAKIDRLLAQSKADYAEGFKDGFAAGQAAGGGGGGPSSDGRGSEFGGSLF